jgi:hypothetical protein
LAEVRDTTESAENATWAKEVPALREAAAQAASRIAEADKAFQDARTRLEEALKQATRI